ncbi:MAG: hypothetical protein AAFR13_04495 [Pseudomonadota bacterium]
MTFSASTVPTYDRIMGATNLAFFVLMAVTAVMGERALWVWMGLILFGVGTWFFFRQLTAPRAYLTLSTQGLEQRVGERVIESYAWDEIAGVETAGRRDNVIVHLAGNDRALTDLYPHERRLVLGRYGRDQRKLAEDIREFQSKALARG